MSEEFPLQPPEPDYVSERYILKVPYAKASFADPWKLRVHAEKMIEEQIGDEVQLTSLKVKKPNFLSILLAKLLRREPQAKLYATVKF